MDPAEDIDKIIAMYGKDVPATQFILQIGRTLLTNSRRTDALIARIRQTALDAIARNSSAEYAESLLQLFGEDALQTAALTLFITEEASHTDRARIALITKSMPLFHIFVSVYFAPPRDGADAASLAAYYNCCAAGGGGQEATFVREIAFLYVFRVDDSVEAHIRGTAHVFVSMGEKITAAIPEETVKWVENGGRRRKITYKLARPTPELYNILVGRSIPTVRSWCIVADGESDALVAKLVLAVPYVLKNWASLPIREYVRPYRRIAACVPALAPETPAGLVAHLAHMTPAHLRLCMQSVMASLPTGNDDGVIFAQ